MLNFDFFSRKQKFEAKSTLDTILGLFGHPGRPQIELLQMLLLHKKSLNVHGIS